ncbi:MAG: N4-gp56 family major capsid protein [Peptostreptococcaceae bacterium]|nr:N4-gp56 family major capsid protein [Peptostreptococcaceae bacterium]
MTITKMEHMINPEVLASMVDGELEFALKFTNLATVDHTLVGRAGNTVSLPAYKMIGEAVDVAEGEAIPVEQLATENENVTVKKAGKGVRITDEAILSGYGDPLGQASKQLAKAIASKVDSDVMACLDKIGPEMTITKALSAEVVSEALVKFGEDIEGQKVLLISPAQLHALKQDPTWLSVQELGKEALAEGAIGQIHGCDVVISNRVDGANYIVKPGAVAIYLKRETSLETERIPSIRATELTVDKHYTVHLADVTKAIKIAGVGRKK